MNTPSTIWSNAHFPEDAMAALRRGVEGRRLLLSQASNASILAAGSTDPLLTQAEIAFGQPDPRQVIDLPGLRWVHLTTAGYTRYDTAAVRAALQSRGGILTNSSSVYDEPCAQHALAMMLSLARQLPQCWVDQSSSRAWDSSAHRGRSHLLGGQTALILGMGAIARRLIELLAPLKMNLLAVRRTVSGSEPIRTLPYTQLPGLLPQADHVLNILPANASTEGMFNASLLAAMKPTALFYNIGRGTTVDQTALQSALESGAIAGAYLDVTDPEPLPANHPLWRAPNCWITPHTAGGHADEFHRLVRHFFENLARYERGQPLNDRVI